MQFVCIFSFETLDVHKCFIFKCTLTEIFRAVETRIFKWKQYQMTKKKNKTFYNTSISLPRHDLKKFLLLLITIIRRHFSHIRTVGLVRKMIVKNVSFMFSCTVICAFLLRFGLNLYD